MQTSAVQTLKLAIVELTGLSKDTLHVYVGLGVFLAVAIAGEVVDMRRVRWDSDLLVRVAP